MKRPEETNYPHSKVKFEAQQVYLDNLIEQNIYSFTPFALFETVEP